MMPVAHFEIHAADPERTGKFYGDIFGWKVSKWDGPMEYYLVSAKTEGTGIDGALVRRRTGPPADGAPTNAYVCTIAVDSLDRVMEQVSARGGEIVVPKDEIPGVGWLAYAKDPEGNVFGLLQPNQP